MEKRTETSGKQVKRTNKQVGREEANGRKRTGKQMGDKWNDIRNKWETSGKHRWKKLDDKWKINPESKSSGKQMEEEKVHDNGETNATHQPAKNLEDKWNGIGHNLEASEKQPGAVEELEVGDKCATHRNKRKK